MPSTGACELFAPFTATTAAKLHVIAELGVNHDGQLDKALDLVTAAAAAGADSIKLQVFSPEALLSNQARLAIYQQGKADDAQQLLRGLTLEESELEAVRDAADDNGLALIATPFSLADLDTLDRLAVDAVKIASPDVVNLPLLRAALQLNKPTIVSTGAAQLEEVAAAADLLREHAAGACLLQCVSSYPAGESDAAIGGVGVLAETFDLPVGYSDHTTELITGALAVAAGACVLEKHLTYDRDAAGPDHAASMDPVLLSHYIELSRQAVNMRGPTAKRVLDCEADVRGAARQSLCATADLEAGHTLTAADLTFKRPGAGIPAAQLEHVVGQTLSKPVRKNDLLTPEYLQ